MAYIFLLLGLFTLSLAQSTCQPHTPPSSGRVTLTYTPYVTPQTPPLSTVYNHIVTAWTYAVDCRYVSIQQVDDNQMISGAFSGTPTTSDALTITRIGCIQQSAAITRRDLVRGYPSETSLPTGNEETLAEPISKLEKRAVVKSKIVAAAVQQADEIPPDAQGMSVRAYNYVVQVNTALYALNLYNTGFNMSATCSILNDPITKARLVLASVDPAQAAAIICFAAQYGLYFDMSNAQLLSDLLSIIYSIEIKSGFTTNTTHICDELRLGPAGLLGIDTQGVESFVCGNQAPALTATIPFTTGSASNGPIETSSGSDRNVTVLPPFGNATAAGVTSNVATTTGLPGSGRFTATNTLTADNYTGTVSVTASDGTARPATTSNTFNIIFPNATVAANLSHLNTIRVPPSPTSPFDYEVWTTSTTFSARLPRY